MSLESNSFTQALRVAMMMGRTPRISFLENQQITKTGSVTAVSTAVQRLNMVRKADRLFIACVLDGVGRVYYSFPQKKIGDHTWIPTYFNETAEDIAITFDGMAHQNGPDGREFITSRDPWIFWVHNGECHGRILNNLGDTIFAAEHCTKVDAICDLTKDKYYEGLGLILFLLIEGQIYYRQLLHGEWTDAELISFGPSNVVWEDIQAFRTWDFRIGLQAKTTNGEVYELFSEYQGVTARLGEHITLFNVAAYSNLTRIYFHDFKLSDEHINLADIKSVALFGGLYEIGNGSILSAYNISDDNDNWGKIVVVRVSHHLNPAEVSNQPQSFLFVDSRSTAFLPTTAEVGEDGLSIYLHFNDFNSANGQCSISYTPGAISTMAGYVLQAGSVNFTPTNLVPPIVDAPEIINAWNI